MKLTGYVSHWDCSRHDTGWRHPEHQGRLPAVARAVYRDMLDLFEPLLEIEAVPATPSELALAHEPAYIERVRARCAESEAVGSVLPLDPDDPEAAVVSGASWDAATAAAGAGRTAADAVLRGEVRNAFCAIRPPGSGAGPASAGNFAIFNNAALTALHLLRRGSGPILLLELGAHPGLGSAAIAAGADGFDYRSVALASHLTPAALAAGWATGLDATAAVDQVVAALIEAVDRSTEARPPAFLLLSLGCDTLANDPRGGMALEPVDFYTITAAIRERAEALCAGRLVSLLEGGYDPARLGSAVVQHLRALAALPPAGAAL